LNLLTEPVTRTMSAPTGQCSAGPDNVRLTVCSFIDPLHIDYHSRVLCCLLLSKIIHCVQMPFKRIAKRKIIFATSSDSSSVGNDDFIIPPRARRSTRRTDKAPRGSGAGSSSQHAEEEEPSDAI
jgi:hypothetical protein